MKTPGKSRKGIGLEEPLYSPMLNAVGRLRVVRSHNRSRLPLRRAEAEYQPNRISLRWFTDLRHLMWD